MPTRVKICGITRPEDAALAAELGADAIGLNFIGGPRKISWATAKQITTLSPPLVRWVGLFTEIVHTEDSDDPEATSFVFSRFTDLQIYPVEGKRFAPIYARWSLWIVSRVHDRNFPSEARELIQRFPSPPGAILLDTASKSGQLGGTGESFNWNWISEARDAGELDNLPPIILAGGLTPENVAEAIRIAKPYGVDVSSGVEVPGKPGIKDPIKMRDFIQAAKAAL